MSDGGKILSFPELPEHRLRRAIMKLEEALQEQGEAVAGFRASMSDLATAMVGLDRSVQDYRTALDGAAHQAGQAHRAALALEAQAEAMARRV